MKVLICAGNDKTKIFAENCRIKNNMLDIVECPSLKEAVQRISDSGFIFDKLVIYSYAIDEDSDIGTALSRINGIEHLAGVNQAIVIIDKTDHIEAYLADYFLNSVVTRYYKNVTKFNEFYTIVNGQQRNDTELLERAQDLISEEVFANTEEMVKNSDGMYEDSEGYSYYPEEVERNINNSKVSEEVSNVPVAIKKSKSKQSLFSKFKKDKSVKTQVRESENSRSVPLKVVSAHNEEDISSEFVEDKVESTIEGVERTSNIPVQAVREEVLVENVIPKNASRISSSNIKNSGMKLSKRSKIVSVTGSGHTGVTSTTVNLAYAGASVGMHVLIVDMDTEYRSVSAYLHVQVNGHSPQKMGLVNACNTNGMLSNFVNRVFDNVDTLGLSIEEGSVSVKDTIDPVKFHQVLMNAIMEYDLVIIDMPLRLFSVYPAVLSASNNILYVMQNDMSSLLKLIVNLDPEVFGSNTNYQLFCSKLCVMFNMYVEGYTCNGTPINSDTLGKLIDQFSEDALISDCTVVGQIPYNQAFGNQIPTNSIIAMNQDWNNIYIKILKILCTL